jgi:predicted DNA-binding transcriptional regulator AlpA
MKKRNLAKRRTKPTFAIPTGLERLFTVAQISQLGGPCRAKLYDDIKLGRLRAIKFGRSTRISESAYREYIQSAPPLYSISSAAKS